MNASLRNKNQFFVCSAAYISELGFDPHDPNWKLIDYDWVHPTNQTAWKSLYQWLKKEKN